MTKMPLDSLLTYYPSGGLLEMNIYDIRLGHFLRWKIACFTAIYQWWMMRTWWTIGLFLIWD